MPRYKGQVTLADGSSGPLEGVAAGDPAKGDVSFPVDTDAGQQEARLGWVDGTLYIRRTAGTALAGTLGVFVRSEGDRPWVRLGVEGIGQAVLSPYDPFALLDLLAGGPAVQPDGSESVDGRSLDRYVAESQGPGGTVMGRVRLGGTNC